MARIRNLHLLNDATTGVPKRRRTNQLATSASSAAVTVDSDSDDVSRDQDYTPSSRSRARPRRLSYSGGSLSPRPTTPSFSNDDGGMVVEAAPDAPVADEVKLTTTSSEARLQVQTFAAYIDRIANENSQSQTRVTALESQVDASRDEIRNCARRST